MNKRSLTTLIKKFLKNRSTQEENEFLKAYDDSFENEPVPQLSESEEARLENEIFQRITSQIQHDREEKVSRHIQFRTMLMAASVVLALGIGWLFYPKWNSILDIVSPVEYTELLVPAGKLSKITLADGTMVTLNAGSKLKYPNIFRGDIREVQLEGEGYFQVTKRPKQPFVVRTEKLHVKVLGTSFNIRSYRQDARMEVSVVSGKVAVDSNEKGTGQSVLLTPQQKASYTVATGVLEKGICESADEIAWQNGVLNFRNNSMKEVARVLERKFDITIRLNAAMENCNVYAQIGNEPVDLTLKALTRLMDAKIKKVNDIYHITGAGCTSI